MFEFISPVNPNAPKDDSDPPPEGWEHIDTQDYRKALFNFPTELFIACAEWEKRELARHQQATQ